MIRMFILIVILSIIYGCGNNSQKTPTPTPTLKKHPLLNHQTIQKLNIAVEEEMYPFDISNIYVDDSSSFFYGVHDNKLHLFDLKKQKLLKKVEYLTKNPKGVGKIGEAFVHNFDSIFLYMPYMSKLMLSDTTGSVLAEWEVDTDKLDNFDGLEIGEEGNHFYYDNRTKSCILYYYSIYDPYEDVRFFKEPFKISYSLTNSKIAFVFGVYPDDFVNEDYFFGDLNEDIIFTANEDNYFLSYLGSHLTKRIDPVNNKVIENLYLKSQFLSPDFELIKKTYEFQQLLNIYNSAGYYINLIYDKYRKVYYKVVKHKQPLKNAQGKINQKLQSEWSIMVLNEQMEIKGESLFPGSKYNFDIIKVIPEGILISRDNEYSDQNIEGVLQFDVVIIE